MRRGESENSVESSGRRISHFISSHRLNVGSGTYVNQKASNSPLQATRRPSRCSARSESVVVA